LYEREHTHSSSSVTRHTLICLRRCAYSSSVVRCAKLVLLFYIIIINSCRVCVSSIRWLFLLCKCVRNPTYHLYYHFFLYSTVVLCVCPTLLSCLLDAATCTAYSTAATTTGNSSAPTSQETTYIHTICLPHIYLVYMCHVAVVVVRSCGV
ncbi:unnamed protein product, partial [Ectocarpus fasciculatus]